MPMRPRKARCADWSRRTVACRHEVRRLLCDCMWVALWQGAAGHMRPGRRTLSPCSGVLPRAPRLPGELGQETSCKDCLTQQARKTPAARAPYSIVVFRMRSLLSSAPSRRRADAPRRFADLAWSFRICDWDCFCCVLKVNTYAAFSVIKSEAEKHTFWRTARLNMIAEFPERSAHDFLVMEIDSGSGLVVAHAVDLVVLIRQR